MGALKVLGALKREVHWVLWLPSVLCFFGCFEIARCSGLLVIPLPWMPCCFGML